MSKYQFYLDGTYKYKGTLAQKLDNRITSIDEPTASSLPSTINPFKFLYEYCLKHNLRIIKIKQEDCSISGESYRLLDLVNRVIAPESYVLFYLEAKPIESIFNLDNLEESVTGMKFKRISESTTITTQEGVRMFYMNPQCNDG